MKFTAAFLVAAHAAAKQIVDATLTYAQKLGRAMKAAYAAAKAPKVEEVIFEVGYAKAALPCSYKQYDYLYSFDNVVSMAGLNSTQFQKRVPVYVASEAIAAAKAGKQVRFVLA